MEDALNTIEDNNLINSTKHAIEICHEYIGKLKKHTIENDFNTTEDEAYFFKFIKPKFLSKLIFYSKWHNIHLRNVASDNKATIKFYKSEYRKLKSFFNENIEFQIYLSSGQTHLDTTYFTRNNHSFIYNIEPIFIALDHTFNTSHDYITAQLLAYKMLMRKLQDEIRKLSTKNKNSSFNQYKWTDKKVDLVELIYAIHTTNSINRGNIEISELAEVFSKMFNEDLGNIYRIYAEIKNRKNPTRYIDNLKDKLLQKIDDELGN